MDEYVDIVDTKGIPTGETCLKSEAHKLGLLHASIHIWFYTSDRKVLIQLRKEDKDTYPNCWDVSEAGHITAGESAITSAIRETQGEIGLKITAKDLTKIQSNTEKHFLPNGIIDWEYHHIYVAELKVPLSSLTPQPEEVADLKLISFEGFKQKINTKNSNFVPHDAAYYQHIVQNLEAQFSL